MIFLFIYSVFSIIGFQSENFEKDLSSLWKVYDKDLNRLIPIEDPNSRVPNISFSLDETFKSGVIEMGSCDSEVKLIYINSFPYKVFKDSIRITISELAPEFQSSKMLFTVYFNKPHEPDCLSTTLIYSEDLAHDTNSERNIASGQNKKDYSYFTNFLISALIVIGFISIYTFNRSSGEITDLWGIERSLSPRNRDELLLKSKPFDKLGISILALLSIVVSIVYQIAFFLSPDILVDLNVIGNNSFGSLFGNWAIISLFLFIFFSIKYLLIKVFSSLFNLDYFKYIQHYNNLRFAIWIFTLGLVIFSCIFFAVRSPDISWFIPFLYAIPILLFIRMLIVFLKLISEGRYKVFHLFSYFCATEILPFLLVFKFILD